MPGLCPSSPRLRKRGFSLLELLVAIGMIALLISILLPSLSRAREQAHSTQCLANLNQQGVAAFMYAYERGGGLPSATTSQNTTQFESAMAFAKIPRSTARILDRMVSRASAVFYCPANQTQPFRPTDFAASVASPPTDPLDAQILYWWLANPAPDATASFIDSDGDGLLTDEYLRRVDARRISDVTIATDQSRQEYPPAQDSFGWYFVHGSQGAPRGTVNTRALTAWKNNLYGDGHAAVVRAASVIPRWGSSNRAGW